MMTAPTDAPVVMADDTILYKLDAVQYLVNNGPGHSEWAEAAMWSATIEVMQGEPTYTVGYLNMLIGQALHA